MNPDNSAELVIKTQDSHLNVDNQNRIVAFSTDSHGENNNINQERVSVTSLFAVLKQRKWLILSITLATLLLSLMLSWMMNPVYRSSTTLKINANATKVVNFDVEVGNKLQADENYFQGEFKLLQSRAILERVIDELALQEPLQELASKKSIIEKMGIQINQWSQSKTAQSIGISELFSSSSSLEMNKPLTLVLQEKITPIPSKHLGLIDVTVNWSTAEGAAAIANSLTANFIKLTLERRLKLAQETREALNKQLVLTKQKLQDSEQKILEYSKKQNLIRADGDKSLASKKLEALNTAYTNAQRERILAEMTFQQQKDSSGNIRILDNKVIESIKIKLGDLQTKYQEQLKIYKPSYPSMIQLRDQITQTKEQLDTELSTIKKGVNTDLQNRYLTAKKNEEQIKQSLEQSKLALLDVQDKSIGYNHFLREVETNKHIYEGLLQRVKEVAVVEDIGTSHISVVEPAYPPYRKHKPDVPIMLLLGLLSGLLIGSTLALQLSANDSRIHNIDDLSTLSNIPILGVFPLIKNQAKALLQNKSHEPAVAEAFRSLRTKLNFSIKSGMPRILHITSSEPNEGKTSTAINLATVIEETGKRVLLIDADMRIPSVHHYLGKENSRGLSDVLTENESLENVIQPIGQSSLHILSAGQHEEKSADLLSSDKMLEVLNWAAKHYDHVIIDSPPVLGLADALILSNRANGTLFVVSSNNIDKKFLVDTLKNLELSYGNVIGFILTKAAGKAQGYYTYDNYYKYSNSKKLSFN